MAHIIAGYPSIAEAENVAKALVAGGVDIVEMQVPFSDPMADGPTIAVACEEALKKGATVVNSLELLAKVSQLGKPVAVMTYTNPVFKMGIATFVQRIAERGASALIVPDCPFDSAEGRLLLKSCNEQNIYFIPVVSPGVPRERLQAIASTSKGFVYCTTRQGITGATGNFAQDLKVFIEELKDIFKLPIAVGFGVKSKEDVQQLGQIADIVIAGSVFVNAIQQKEDIRDLATILTS